MKPSLIDRYGRVQRTLRISVTDRCQMRCRYCLPNGSPPRRPREEVLRFEEMVAIAGAAAERGMNRIRLTGGEPLLKRGIVDLVSMIRDIPGIDEIALTTNGLLLADMAEDLAGAGITSVSVSLDAMDRRAFEEVTGLDAFERVTEAIDHARRIPGLSVQANAVLLSDEEERIIPLIEFARTGIPVRFIEFMPFEGTGWSESKVLPGVVVARRIGERFPFREIARSRKAAPSRRFLFTDGKGGFGLIMPVSEPFCEACDRLRLRSDGLLFNCLFSKEPFDMRGAIGDADELGRILDEAARAKGPGGMIEFQETAANPSRIMADIGG